MAAPSLSTGQARPEILLLRGVAVLAVLTYHLWPGRLVGGFAGIDVFFVISGYLVTTILVRMRERDGRIDFWRYLARRARRILPSAITVLLACLIGMFALVSITDWGRVAGETFASALLVENWALIAGNLVYAAPDVATPVQHYWTLAVEAQFYVVWALLLMLVLGRRRVAVVAVASVFAVSLVVSIIWCAADPASGYFSTATRMWELAAGGLLALLLRRIPPLRIGVPLASAGWVLIAGTFLFLNIDLQWPGLVALLPVAGTVLVIAAGVPTGARRLQRLADNPVTRTLADSSYAIYLWHWPLVVLAAPALGHALTTADKIGIAVASLVLGWATTVLVERPIRYGPLARARPLATMAVAVLAIAMIAVPSIAVRHVMQRTTELYSAVAAAPASGLCIGAEARMPGADCTDGPYPRISPDPLGDWEQVSVLHGMGCASDEISAVVQSCEFGDLDGAVRVALVGDSHAMKLWPALVRIAQSEGWHLTTFLKAQCDFTIASFQPDPDCHQWLTDVADRLQTEGPWNLVMTTGASQTSGVAGAADAYRAGWQPLIDAGARVVVVRDNPYSGADTHACVAAHLADTSACDRPRAESFFPDVMAETASTTPGASTIDLSELFCDDTTCFAVVGGVITHRDGDHVTDAFSVSYAPYLAAQLATLEPGLFGPAAAG